MSLKANLAGWMNSMKYSIHRNWIRNPASRRQWSKQPSTLNAAQTEIVRKLQQGGYALANVVGVLSADRQSVWENLARLGDDFANSDTVRAQQEYLRHSRVGEKEFEKRYIARLFAQQERPELSLDHPLLAFALDSAILDAVNSYLGLAAKLVGLNLWYTIPTNSEARIASQRWHRDWEDRRLVKVFVYFNDVNADSGALEYVSGSAYGGPFAKLCPFTAGQPSESRLYPAEAAVALIPAESVVMCSGPRGTAVFCDTAGLHRGGFARLHPRNMAVLAYVSPASQAQRFFSVKTSSFSQLTSTQRHAIS